MKINQIHRRALSLLLSFTLVLGIFGTNAVGAFAASDDLATLSLDSGDIIISDSGNYLITQTDSGNSTHTITVTAGTPGITLRNVSIDVSKTGGCPFSIAAGASVTLTLAGKSTLKSGNNHAGIQVAGNAALNVTDASTGSLTATGGRSGAGIGGCENGAGGNITINGGTVTANGGGCAAGIGGGEDGAGGNITMTGGTVTASGGAAAAGIGGGANGNGGTIIINGGIIEALGGTGDPYLDAAGGQSGAGIGGGSHGGLSGHGGAGGNITINGGAVTANGGRYGAGIGGGDYGAGGTVTIDGGVISASGANGGTGYGAANGGAGIGGGIRGDGGTVAISGGMVSATGGMGGAGIGGGDHGGTVTISGSGTQVIAKGQGGGNDIGSEAGYNTSGGSLTVDGSGSAESLPLLALLSAGTNANSPTYKNCRIITGSAGSQKEDFYSADGSRTSGPAPVTASLTAKPAAGSAVTLSTSVKGQSGQPVTSGTLSFSYIGAKDSGPIPGADNVAVGTDYSWALPTNGPILVTAQYTDSSHPYDTLKTSFFYNPQPIDLSTFSSTGLGYTFPVSQNGWYEFTGGTADTPAQNHIDVAGGVTAFITLSDTVITSPTPTSTANALVCTAPSSAVSIAAGASVNLTLLGTNKLKGTESHAGLEVPDSAALTVTDASTGSLTATSGGGTFGGAGIGGSYRSSGSGNSSAGSITIDGGTVTAYGSYAAGIGGGAYSYGNPVHGSITINGGTVTATGGDFAAGIGGGDNGVDGAITINGGTVTATGGAGGAGIGGGSQHAGGSITINGGTVTATGGADIAGIGGGGAGIGGGGVGQGLFDTGGAGGDVQISGSDTQVTATGAGGGKDIGSGRDSTASGGTLTVSGTDEEHGPYVKFQSGGTNAAKPTRSTYQFADCEIFGDFATGADGGDIKGWYDAAGKIRLSALVSAAPKNSASVSLGNPVTLTAQISRYGFGDTPALSGKLSFLRDSGTGIAANVSVSNGTATADWTPADTAEHTLTVQYVTAAYDRFALNAADIQSVRYSAGKATPTITAPTASGITAGSMLSSSTLSGGNAKRADGTGIPGTFAWAQPNLTLTTSGSYQVLFTPDDSVNYNTASVMVFVTVTAIPTPTPTESRHSSSTPSLPSGITDPTSGFQIDLSGVTLPAGVTKVTFSAAPAAQNGVNDPNAASVLQIIITQANLNVIGLPYIYNIQLLDQNGNPITGFIGKIKVKVPIPEGIVGTPHIFRYEESSGTLTDMNAVVEDGFLVFETDHFSCYAIAGTGDSITLDTKTYQMPVNGSYQIGVKLTGSKAASLKVTSTNDKVASAVKLKNGNVQVTGKGIGTAYIMFDVYDGKNKLLTHASVRIDVKTGIRPRGDSTRQTGLF